MVNVLKAITGQESGSPSLFKIYSLAGITTLAAVLSSYFFNYQSISLGLVSLLVFLVFFSLEVILLSGSFQYSAPAVAANSIGLALFFYGAISLYFSVAFGVLYLFLFLASREGKKEMENMVKIRVSRVVRAVIGYALIGIVIFLVAASILNGIVSPSREKVDKFVDGALTPVARRYVPDFSSKMETGVFLSRLAERNLAANNAFRLLSPALKQRAVNQSVGELKREIESYIKSEIDLRQSVSENIYQVLQLKLGNLSPEAKTYWTIIIVALVILTVKSVEFIIVFPLALVVYLLYELALILGFARVEFRNSSREVVILAK